MPTTVDRVIHEPRLPRDADVQALDNAYVVASEYLQRLGFQLKAVLEPYFDENKVLVRPTYADVGRLWALIANLENDHWALGQEIESLRKQLDDLNQLRWEDEGNA